MAEDGALPGAVRRGSARTQAQEAGLLFFGATILVPALLLGSFATLLDEVTLADTGWPLFRFGRRLFGAPPGRAPAP